MAASFRSRSTVSPIHDEIGRTVGASQIAQDITGRRNTEAQFQAKPDQFEILAHALDQVPAMVRKLNGEIMLWGHGLQALYGWPAEKAVGSISHELLATEFPVPLPAIEAELLETGLWQGELVRTHLDGRLVIVASRWALYRRDGGDPVSVLEFDSDVTETKRAQSMLKEREARLRSILETAPDAIIAIDERGIIQYFSKSAEKLFGYAPGEVIGRNVKMLMPAPHRENHDGYLARYLRDRREAHHRHWPAGGGAAQRWRHLPDGTRCWRGEARRGQYLHRLHPGPDGARQNGAGSSSRRRRWRPSDSSPAASLTTSTIF